MEAPVKPFLPQPLTRDRLLAFSLSGTNISSWQFDVRTSSYSIEQNFQLLFNYHDANILDLEIFHNLISAGDRRLFRERLQKALSVGSDGRLSIVVQTENTPRKLVHLIGQAYLDEAGQVGGLIGSAVEIPQYEDDRKHGQIPPAAVPDENYPSEERFRSLITEAPVATCLFVGKDMVIEIANDIMIGYWGKDRSVIGKRLIEAVPELIGQPFISILEEIYRTGIAYETKNAPAQLKVNGVLSTFYFDFTYKPLFDHEGNVYGIMDMAIDVTSEAIYLRELQASRERLELAEGSLRNVIELAEIGTWRVDLLTETVECSPRLLEWYGLNSSEPVALSTIRDMIDPEDLIKVSDVLREAAETGNSPFYSCEYSITAKDGTVRALRDRGQIHFDADGKPVTISGSVQDITHHILDKISLEKQINLRTSELIDSLADLERSNSNLLQFAYIASHDLQEPLRKIQTFSDLLIKRYTVELGPGIDYLDRIQGAAKRMSILIKDLLDFSGISIRQQASSTVRLNQVIEAVLVDLEVSIADSGAQVRVAQLPAVKGDRTQLGQLFSNLLSNAIKFRRPGLTPSVEIDYNLISKAQLPPQVNPARLASQYYRIDVMDNGIGFDAKYNDRIFQVFQRLHTKSEFAGTGIGLAICEKVAANHGGAIKAASVLGKGSVFSVHLPV